MMRPALALAVGVALALATGPARAGRARPAAGRRLTREQLVELARSAGWSPADAETAAAISLAESGGDPRAQLVTAREDSRGLWAINIKAHPGADPARLWEPAYNAATAYKTWTAAGRGGRDPWRPWSVWAYDRKGRYQGPGRGAVAPFLRG
jgi:hypothetical protein